MISSPFLGGAVYTYDENRASSALLGSKVDVGAAPLLGCVPFKVIKVLALELTWMWKTPLSVLRKKVFQRAMLSTSMSVPESVAVSELLMSWVMVPR